MVSSGEVCATCSATAAREYAEEGNEVLVVGEQAIAIEVDAAALRCRERDWDCRSGLTARGNLESEPVH
jgi:hypothetical protein